MIRSLVFDKDGVILDMAGTWMPVARQVADYTLSRQPGGAVGRLTRADLLAAVGVDDEAGIIDPFGMFAREPFAEVRKAWQAMLPLLTVRQAWSTVAWSFPPQWRPMLASELLVIFFAKYIAI